MLPKSEHALKTLPHLLKRAHFAVRQAMDNELAKHGLTASQFEVLMRVTAGECMEHRSLLQEMEVASPTLTKLVDTLVQNGFLDRSASDTDARVKLLTLTETGEAIKATMKGIYPDFLNQVATDLTETERLQLMELLCRVTLNAESLNR